MFLALNTVAVIKVEWALLVWLMNNKIDTICLNFIIIIGTYNVYCMDIFHIPSATVHP